MKEPPFQHLLDRVLFLSVENSDLRVENAVLLSAIKKIAACRKGSDEKKAAALRALEIVESLYVEDRKKGKK